MSNVVDFDLDVQQSVEKDKIVFGFNLPSKGLLYGGLIPEGRIQMSPMRSVDEKMMVGASDRQAMISTLLERCLITNTMPYGDYLVTDEAFMLLLLRGITYGFSYDFNMVCSQCNGKFRHSVGIPDGLQITELNEDDIEPYEVVLPINKKKLSIRQLRVKDEKEVLTHIKREAVRRNAKNSGDAGYMIRLAKHIIAIDDVDVSPLEAISFCEKLYARDVSEIRSEIDAHQSGADIILDVKCPLCGSVIEEMMPFTADFFRASSSQVRRERGE